MANVEPIGWDALDCAYFAETCRQSLSHWLKTHGFLERDTTPGGGIIFRRGDVFLEISYESETSPNYSPTIVMGVGDGKYDTFGQLSGIPFWFVILDTLPEHGYALWTFSSTSELRSVLKRIQDEILETHAKSLWLDRDRLIEQIARFRASVEHQ